MKRLKLLNRILRRQFQYSDEVPYKQLFTMQVEITRLLFEKKRCQRKCTREHKPSGEQSTMLRHTRQVSKSAQTLENEYYYTSYITSYILLYYICVWQKTLCSVCKLALNKFIYYYTR